MKAWVVRQLGGPETMRFEDVDAGAPANGVVRIAVRASAINYFDALMIAGQYQVKPDLPFVPGAEVSGVVESAPRGAHVKSGDRVTALLDSGGLTRGGYAEISDAVPSSVLPMPDTMSFEDGAGFTLIFQTAWFGLHRRAKLLSGETLLVHAGAGGVGSAAIQVGKAAGAMVIATAGSDEKTAVCRQLGADHVINYKTDRFEHLVRKITQKKGVDVVFEHTGADTWDGSLLSMKRGGRLVTCGATSGPMGKINLMQLFQQQYKIFGSFGFTIRNVAEALAYIAKGVKPVIDSEVSLADFQKGLERLERRRVFGKIVVRF